MTGFGRAEHATNKIAARAEAASVNRKQGEIVVQLPRAYQELEAEIRKTALGKLSRGRVTISVQLELPEGSAGGIRVNTGRARAIEAAFTELSDAIDRPVQLSASDFLRAPEIIEFDDTPTEPTDAMQAILPAVETALDQMIAMRASEGKHLHDDIATRISTLENIADDIISFAPSVKKHYAESLHTRLAEAGLDIALDDERILKEIGLFADRCDISEEITRLRSHFEKFREYLASDEPVGRSLDFLCQELNREFNTIGSKAHDATLAQHIVNAKTELEKIREQVQNVE
ncbi:MAG: YicC/YloC family endoribonuclease [Akkermansiaceae bacterium]